MKLKHAVVTTSFLIATLSIHQWDKASVYFFEGSRDIASINLDSIEQVYGSQLAPSIAELTRKENQLKEKESNIEEEIAKLNRYKQLVKHTSLSLSQRELMRDQLQEMTIFAQSTTQEIEEIKGEIEEQRDEAISIIQSFTQFDDDSKNQIVQNRIQEVQEQLEAVEKLLDKLKLESEAIAQSEILITLDHDLQICLQEDQIKNLEEEIREHLGDKEEMLERLTRLEQSDKQKEENADEVEEDQAEKVAENKAKEEDENKKTQERNKNQETSTAQINELTDAFRGLLMAQLQFQNQMSSFQQMQSMPFQMGHSMMFPYNQNFGMTPFPNNGYYGQGLMAIQQQSPFGVDFLNQSFAPSSMPMIEDVNIRRYYGIDSLPFSGYERGFNSLNPQSDAGNLNHIRQTAPNARFHLFNGLERNPAQNQHYNFFGQPAQQSSIPQVNGQREVQDVETFYGGTIN